MVGSVDSAIRAVLRDELRKFVVEELRSFVSEEVRRAMTDALQQLDSDLVSEDGEYLSTKHAAQIAGVQPATIRRWISQCKLQRHGAGRQILVRKSELEELLVGSPDVGVVDLDARARQILTGRK